ncbi:MAG: hypothetical protein AVDCRST_MAG77-1237 [uncultured Chloroflexi bacterium]|uniref:Uncharacterized protein n=1 Tax=uncultured Chloroflexota bacterium TaxID=166587 RepID=A0A6J4HYF6_9CHLR|nr:MAG: hypothetical protein AVDCRST_MAG77-1237 [uncultured Chloroflexota bacterium]
MQTRFSAERVMDAPAEVVYHLISDYSEHHRDHPEGFLPDAFSDMVVERGGVGHGTVVRFSSKMGGRKQTMTASITETQPGRVLVEAGEGVVTTFTVEPEGSQRARVRFDTVFDFGGVTGLMVRLFAPGMLRPIYAEEMDRLERHAKAHPALAPTRAEVPVVAAAPALVAVGM